MRRTILVITCMILFSSAANAQWLNRIIDDPITDRPRANAQVQSNEKVNYDRPMLFYSCEVNARGEVEQHIQVKTREIHRGNGGTVIFRIDGGDPFHVKASYWGDYRQAPTILRPEGDFKYKTTAERLASMEQTRSSLIDELREAQAAGNEVRQRQINGQIDSLDLARQHLSGRETENLQTFDALVEAIKGAQRQIVVRTSEVTFSVPVSGSTRTINRAKAHCGI